jgi:hypothetical protein
LIDELEFVENALMYGNEEEGIPYNDYLSSDHESLFYENACDVPQIRGLDDCETVGDKVMMQGLHSAISMYI